MFLTAFLYVILSSSYSVIGGFLPSASTVSSASVLESLTIEHVIGHIVWGLIVGFVTLSVRYAILTGIFAILLDFDHLILFLELDSVTRMAHSIPFGIISMVVMMIIFGKKDYRLGAISIAAVLTHISFDIFTGGTSAFPLFTPIIE